MGVTSEIRSDELPSPPSAIWTLLEGRAMFEFAAFLSMRPLLNLFKQGDGHPVVVLPGLMASDLSTQPLRKALKRLGYQAYGWGLGRNSSISEELEAKMIARVIEVSAAHQSKVSIIGWSLGGLFAREVAKSVPESVRSVITLGSPISAHLNYTTSFARARADSGNQMHNELRKKRMLQLNIPPPVPTTSIYSKTDGIVAWRGSVQQDSTEHVDIENVVVPSSHMGLGVNPFSFYVIADRLNQAPEDWKPFRWSAHQTRC